MTISLMMMSMRDTAGLSTSCPFEPAACRLTLLQPLQQLITLQQDQECLLDLEVAARVNRGN
jgi:hypothetical protein